LSSHTAANALGGHEDVGAAQLDGDHVTVGEAKVLRASQLLAVLEDELAGGVRGDEPGPENTKAGNP
jgi:hypothetical protein